MRLRYRKLWMRFSRRKDADMDVLNKLQKAIIKAKELNHQLATDPEFERFIYEIRKNLYITECCRRNSRPPKKTFFSRISSLFRKKSSSKVLAQQVEKLFIKQIKDKP